MPSRLVPYGKYLPDLPDLGHPGVLRAENCIYLNGSYTQFLPPSALSTALTARCQGSRAMNDGDGNTFIYAGDATKLYLVTATATDKSGSAYSTGTSGYWKFAQYGSTAIATNLIDAVQSATVGGGSFANLASAAPKAQCLGVINKFVMLGDINDATDGHIYNAVQWNGIDDPTNWPTPATSTAFAAQSGRNTLNADYGRVRHITNGLQFGLVFQERAIYRADYVGGGTVFRFYDFEKSRGLYAPNAIVSVGAWTYYLAASGFFRTDGSTVEAIGDGHDVTFMAELNTSFLERVTAGADPSFGVIYFAYPSTASTDGTPDKIAIYNYDEQAWSFATQACEAVFSAKQLGYTVEDADSINTNMDLLPGSPDDARWIGGTPLLGVFDTSHKYGTFSGSALDATLDTPELQLTEGARSEFQGVKPLVTGSGTVTVKVASRQFQSDSVTFGSAITPSSRSGVAPVRANNYYHRARTVIAGGFDKAMAAEHIWADSSPV